MKKVNMRPKNIKNYFVDRNGFKKRSILFVLIFAVIGVALLLKGFAATGQIYLVSSASTVEINKEVNVTIRINPGTPIDGVEKVRLTYDPAKLQYVALDTSTSPFEADLGQTLSSGSVEVSRATFGSSISADSVIAIVTFRALAGSGNTSLQVSGNAAGSGGFTNPVGGSLALAFSSPTTVTTGSITGIVSSSDGNPIEGATINYAVNGSKRSIKTTASGSYAISNLPVGTYSLKFSARKHQTQTVSVTVAAGSVITKNITLQKR